MLMTPSVRRLICPLMVHIGPGVSQGSDVFVPGADGGEDFAGICETGIVPNIEVVFVQLSAQWIGNGSLASSSRGEHPGGKRGLHEAATAEAVMMISGYAKFFEYASRPFLSRNTVTCDIGH
jgi:hypothetical protein